MNLDRRTRLEKAGIDVDDALKRVMGSENLFERLLIKFLNDGNYAELLDAITVKDGDRALAASHTLKGICGNLSMTKLYELFTEQVEALRAGDFVAAVSLMDHIVPAYEGVAAAIGEKDNERS